MFMLCITSPITVKALSLYSLTNKAEISMNLVVTAGKKKANHWSLREEKRNTPRYHW